MAVTTLERACKDEILTRAHAIKTATTDSDRAAQKSRLVGVSLAMSNAGYKVVIDGVTMGTESNISNSPSQVQIYGPNIGAERVVYNGPVS